MQVQVTAVQGATASAFLTEPAWGIAQTLTLQTKAGVCLSAAIGNSPAALYRIMAHAAVLAKQQVSSKGGAGPDCPEDVCCLHRIPAAAAAEVLPALEGGRLQRHAHGLLLHVHHGLEVQALRVVGLGSATQHCARSTTGSLCVQAEAGAQREAERLGWHRLEHLAAQQASALALHAAPPGAALAQAVGALRTRLQQAERRRCRDFPPARDAHGAGQAWRKDGRTRRQARPGKRLQDPATRAPGEAGTAAPGTGRGVAGRGAREEQGASSLSPARQGADRGPKLRPGSPVDLAVLQSLLR